jgi:catechol 2,3-dioxygenase-like lactoylglutathione lyase family enzyme
MKPNSISGFTCQVRNLAKTAEFYEALGFRRGNDGPDRITFYVNWFFLTFVEDEAAADADRGSGLSVQVKVDDLEDFYNGVVSLRLKPAGEPQQRVGGGREFMLRDPDGYNLVFFDKK